MALEHHLRIARNRIPELNSSVLGTAHNPVSIWCKTHTEYKVLIATLVCHIDDQVLKRTTYLVSFKCPYAFSAINRTSLNTTWRSELPEFDGLIKTATDKITAVGRKSNRVHAIPVSVRTIQALHQNASRRVPNPHGLIQRARGNKVSIWRHGNRRHAVFNGKNKEGLVVD